MLASPDQVAREENMGAALDKWRAEKTEWEDAGGGVSAFGDDQAMLALRKLLPVRIRELVDEKAAEAMGLDNSIGASFENTWGFLQAYTCGKRTQEFIRG